MKISKRDIIMGERIVSWAILCPLVPTLFLEGSEKEDLELAGRECLLSGHYITPEGVGKVSRADCPIRQLIEDLERNSLPFLEYWRQALIFSSTKERIGLIILSMMGMETLYLANQKRIPLISKDFIVNFLKKSFIQGEKYLNPALWMRIEKELIRLNPDWFLNSLKSLQIDFRISVFTWRAFLLLMEIFLEGLKPIGPLSPKEKEKFFRKIEKFTNEEGKG